MRFVWSEHPTIDDANRLVFEVTADGTSVHVCIAEDAEEELGLPVCKAMAERRLHDGSITGLLPKVLLIRALDFSAPRRRS